MVAYTVVMQMDAALERLAGGSSFDKLHRDLKLAVMALLLTTSWGLRRETTWAWLQKCVQQNDRVG